MNNKEHIIFYKDKPTFVILPYEEYISMTLRKTDSDQYVPFNVGDYIKNPLCVMRLETGLSQKKLANKVGVSLEYLKRMEALNAKVPAKLLDRVRQVWEKGERVQQKNKHKR